MKTGHDLDRVGLDEEKKGVRETREQGTPEFSPNYGEELRIRPDPRQRQLKGVQELSSQANPLILIPKTGF
jgi:hypothetical protein